MPALSDVLSTWMGYLVEAAYWDAVRSTVVGWAAGLVIATVAGIAGGTIVGSTPLGRRLGTSTVEFLRPIPSVALIPLAVLMFGTDMAATTMLVVYASFWQVMVQVMYGVGDVDPVARQTAQCFRFRLRTHVTTVLWPTTLPYAITGFRLAASVALIIEVTGELIIGSPGIGQQIAIAQASGAAEQMYALVLTASVFGVLVNTGTRRVERRLLRWHSSVRGEVPR
ncbi:ABC transporter permease [Aeromicrobium sp. CTD01-1L150]|uniref:ABC transporter permease n=1 Tax=Aeromicrobium sp. CTD01-1L150 TaxID=3341830 RepID=UPI0035C01C16